MTRDEVSEVAQIADDDVAVARASAVMAGGTLASRVLGFVRASLLVTLLGATASNLAGNSFALANQLPATIYLLLAGGALNAVLVPQITRADRQGDAGRAVVDRLVTMTLTGLLIVTVALTLAAGPLVAIYASADWPAAQLDLAMAFAVWSIPQIFFYGAYAIAGQILNARQSFGPYTWAPVANNIIAILGLVGVLAVAGPLTARSPGDFGPGLVAAIAGTATLGVAVQALVLLLPLRAVGFRFRPRWRWRGSGLRSAGVVAGWTFAALLCTQAAFLVLTRISTAAGSAAVEAGVGDTTGANAAWTNAFLLFMLPHSLLAVSVVTARFTSLSRSAAADRLDELGRDTAAAARSLIVGMSLPAAGLVVLAQPICVLLFGKGAAQGVAIGSILVAMAIGLPAFSTSYLLQRLFYAMRDGRVPFVVQAVTSATWIASMLVIAQVAPPQWVVPGIAAAMSLSQALACGLLLTWARRRVPGLAVASILSTAARSTLAGLVAAAVVGAVLWRVDAVSSWLLPTVDDRGAAVVVVMIGGAVGAAAFLVVASALRLREIRMFWALAQTVGRRVRR